MYRLLHIIIICVCVTIYHSIIITYTSYDTAIFNWSRSFAEATHLVGEKHVQLPEKIEDCLYEAINSYLIQLDPHSGFFSPKAYKEIKQSMNGTFGGIGIVLDATRQAKDSFLMIIDVIPGGPSDKQDIRAFDKIIEIDGNKLEGMTTEEAVAKLRGKIDTTVELKIIRDKRTDIISVRVTRDIIKEQNSVCFYLPDQKIYYLSLNTFTENAVQQIRKLIETSTKRYHKGLILDLRFNTGGLLTAAIDIVGLFLPHNSLVVETKGKNDNNITQYRTIGTPMVTNSLPIFILINNYTASSAEILAGCLQQYSINQLQNGNPLNVFLLGTRTFGKGSVQEVIPISNASAVKLTTALYYLPGNISIQGVGIEPDFEINRMYAQSEQLKWFTDTHGFERSLPNSIKTECSKKHLEEEKQKEKMKKNEKKKNFAERIQEGLACDNQFKAAVTLINIYNCIQQTQKHMDHKAIVTMLKQTYITDDPLQLEEIKTDASLPNH